MRFYFLLKLHVLHVFSCVFMLYLCHVWLAGNQNDHYNAEMQSRITDLSLLLFDKLEYLEVSKKGLTNFQVMFIEMEVRLLFFLIPSNFCFSIYTTNVDHHTVVDRLEVSLELRILQYPQNLPVIIPLLLASLLSIYSYRFCYGYFSVQNHIDISISRHTK